MFSIPPNLMRETSGSGIWLSSEAESIGFQSWWMQSANPSSLLCVFGLSLVMGFDGGFRFGRKYANGTVEPFQREPVVPVPV